MVRIPTEDAVVTFGQDRDQLRRMYADAWRKFNDGGVLSPLEAQIAAVASEHPEYHRYLGEDGLHEDFTPERGETNPFLRRSDRATSVRRPHDRCAGGDAVGRAANEFTAERAGLPRTAEKTLTEFWQNTVINSRLSWSDTLTNGSNA